MKSLSYKGIPFGKIPKWMSKTFEKQGFKMDIINPRPSSWKAAGKRTRVTGKSKIRKLVGV